MLQNIIFNKLPATTQLDLGNVTPGDLLIVGENKLFSSIPKGGNNTFLKVENGNYVFATVSGNNGGNSNEFTQIDPPSSPVTNNIWNQIDNQGEFLDRWIFTRGLWMSLDSKVLHCWSLPEDENNTISFQLPIDNSYNYWVKSMEYCCLYIDNRTVDNSNCVRILWTLEPSGANFVDFRVSQDNGNLSTMVPIDTVIIPRNGDRIQLTLEELNRSPRFQVGTSISYRLVYPQ